MHFTLPAIHGLLLGILAIVAGLAMLFLPHLLNDIVGVLMIGAGVVWIAGGAWFPGIVSILLGLVVLLLRHFVSYVVGIYLILLSLWFIFASSNIVLGLITIIMGVSIMFFPDILSYMYGAYLLLAGIVALGNYFRWF